MSLGVPGFDFRQEVVLKSRVNWRAVRSDIAQMPWGVIVRSTLWLMFWKQSVVVLLKLGFLVLRLDGDLVMSYSLKNFVKLLSGVSSQFNIAGRA